jgi:hypothetical protein
MARELTSADIRAILDYGSPPEGFDVESLLAWIVSAPTTDEDYQAGCDAMAAAMGLYAYCAHYHGGQGSKEYRVMCELTRPGLYSPGPRGDTLNAEEDSYAILIYEALGGTHAED